MSGNTPLDYIWKSYQRTCDCFTVTDQAFKKALAENNFSLLDKTLFSEAQKDEAELWIQASRKEADNFVILSLWTMFERIILEDVQLQIEHLSDSSPAVLKSICNKVNNEIEYWRMNDILDLFKGIVDKNLLGNVKQVKEYRDWVAHRNERKVKPPNIMPFDAYDRLSKVLDEINAISTNKSND
ncbi:MAG TPA: hypothetical protein VJL89_10685 [Thermodesulfovibrionia bacterium]|nr:hypothetical protein [Thermodesulfovibrionia bacterium]